MTEHDMAFEVLDVVIAKRNFALADHISAISNLAVHVVRSSLWETHSDDEFAKNPYNVELARKRTVETETYLAHCDNLVAFVSNTFIKAEYK